MNLNNTNVFNKIASIKTNEPSINHQWLDVRDQINDLELNQQYVDICQKHGFENKWILVITPKSNALDQLINNRHIDPSKVLRVNSNKVKINIKNVETALSKGNCAAIVLCNVGLKESELKKLTAYAQIGKTQCIVLNNNRTIH